MRLSKAWSGWIIAAFILWTVMGISYPAIPSIKESVDRGDIGKKEVDKDGPIVTAIYVGIHAVLIIFTLILSVSIIGSAPITLNQSLQLEVVLLLLVFGGAFGGATILEMFRFMKQLFDEAHSDDAAEKKNAN